MTWNEAVKAYLNTQRGITADRYHHALEDFAAWYRGTYGEEPEPKLLTDEEAREWRAHLAGVKKYAAATVNVRLSALKGLVRHAGGRLGVKGMRRVQQPVEPLSSGRELGRLVRAVEQHEWGADWMPLRNAALVALIARAGLRVGEVVGLDLEDVALNERSGWVDHPPGQRAQGAAGAFVAASEEGIGGLPGGATGGGNPSPVSDQELAQVRQTAGAATGEECGAAGGHRAGRDTTRAQAYVRAPVRASG